MGFGEAVKSGFNKYAQFSGRARRSEYWWFSLFLFLAYLVIATIDTVVLGSIVLTSIFALGVLLPSLAVGVRRLHDIGKSGWYYLLGFIPLVGGIILLIFFIKDSQPGPNAYGEPVKA